MFRLRFVVRGVMTGAVVGALGGAAGISDVEGAAVVAFGIAALKFSAAALPIAVAASSDAPVNKAASFVVSQIRCLLQARSSVLSFCDRLSRCLTRAGH